MQIRKEFLTDKQTEYIRAYFKDQSPVFFDIETTGLAWKFSHLYLIGLLYEEEAGWTLTQYFLDKPQEETLMLTEFAGLLDRIRMKAGSTPTLVHFNGDTFDLPYIRHKCEFYELADPFREYKSLDLYKEIRPYGKLLQQDSLKQKAIEALLQLDRKDEKSGKELIETYQKYLTSGSRPLLEELYLHNRDDVYGLCQILPILSLPLLFTGAFQAALRTEEDAGVELIIHPSFPFPESIRDRLLPLAGPLGIRLVPVEKTLGTEDLLLQIPYLEGILYHFFENYKDYYYLPDEDQAMHKDIAIYVDAAHRQKAKAANCYQKRSGRFLPDPDKQMSPSFFESYKSQPAYFQPASGWEDDTERLTLYTKSLLSLMLSK